MKGPTAVATHAAGGCREGKTGMDREVEREAEIEGRGIDFHLQQLQFKASLQFRGSAGPGMSPSRARLPVCGQDFPCGPRDSQAAPKENNYSDRDVCEVTDMLRRKEEKMEAVKLLPTTIYPDHCCLFSSAQDTQLCQKEIWA